MAGPSPPPAWGQHRGQETFAKTVTDFCTTREVLQHSLGVAQESQRERVAAKLAKRKAQRSARGMLQGPAVLVKYVPPPPASEATGEPCPPGVYHPSCQAPALSTFQRPAPV